MTKTTHSLGDIEVLMSELYNKLKEPDVTKKEKTECVKRLKLLEKHFNDCNDKHINGKKYPVREVPKPVKKEELLKLIDSVQAPETNVFRELAIKEEIAKYRDLSGVSVGQDFFEPKELGWSKPAFEGRKVSVK